MFEHFFSKTCIIHIISVPYAISHSQSRPHSRTSRSAARARDACSMLGCCNPSCVASLCGGVARLRAPNEQPSVCSSIQLIASSVHHGTHGLTLMSGHQSPTRARCALPPLVRPLHVLLLPYPTASAPKHTTPPAAHVSELPPNLFEGNDQMVEGCRCCCCCCTSDDCTCCPEMTTSVKTP